MDDIPAFTDEIEHYRRVASASSRTPVWEYVPTLGQARAAVLGTRAARLVPDSPVCVIRPHPDWDCEAARLTLQAMGAECGELIPPRESGSHWLSNGRELFAYDSLLEIGSPLLCTEHLPDLILALEDETYGAIHLVLAEPEDVRSLERHQYMIERPLCLSAPTPELLREALAVYHGRALCSRAHVPFEEDIFEELRTVYGLVVD